MIEKLLHDVHQKYHDYSEGEMMDSARGKRSDFALAVTSVEGSQWTAGDCDRQFTLQSLSKPLAYALALGLAGEDAVSKKVDVEQSGEPFNAIELEEDTGRPSNAMLTAGAIAIAGLLVETLSGDAWQRIHRGICGACGRELALDEDSYRSQLNSAHRHRAMAYLMLGQGALAGEVENAIDLYSRQCSLLIDCRDLSCMGATLANKGINPRTGEKVFELEAVQHVQSVMLTCGMYNSSGDWAYRIGIPAKSLISGGLLGIVNRQIGIATYSPPLDGHGHSVRGMKTFSDISEECALHAFHHRNHGSNVLHDEFGG